MQVAVLGHRKNQAYTKHEINTALNSLHFGTGRGGVALSDVDLDWPRRTCDFVDVLSM